jgi:hypothetical protein
MKSTLDWTIIRVPWLNNKPATGKLKVGYYGNKQNMTLSRNDLAKFYIDQIKDNQYIRKIPAISNS